MELKNLFSSNAVTDPLSLSSLIFALLIGSVLAFVLRLHFFRFSNSLSNRLEFMSVLPFIILTTTLIISIVKSSLALSLGLVGALSIVRFRTPIKEPEELAYLFFAISIGLGLGAGQILATVVSSVFILIILTIFIRGKTLNSSNGEIYLNFSGEINLKIHKNLTNLIFAEILKVSTRASLKRYIVNNNNINLTFYISQLKVELLDPFVQDIKKKFPNLSVTLLDQKNVAPF